MSLTIGESVEFLDAQARMDLETREYIERGIDTTTYAPFTAAMVIHAAEQVSQGRLDPEDVTGALSTAAGLYYWADREYRSNLGALDGEALREHQANVLNGVIHLVPIESATTPEQAKEQVKTANDFLSYRPSSEEAALAAINYGALFRPETMATAQRTIDRSAIDELLETADSSVEAMPHLSVTNWSIGQVVAGIYRHAARSPNPPRLRLIDIGSGSGATLAAITSSIKAIDDIDRRPEMAVTALEATPELFDQLASFASSDPSIGQLGLEVVTRDRLTSESISELGALTIARADAVTAIEGMDLAEQALDDDQITIITANYSLHRLAHTKKTAIFEHLHPLANKVLLAGDLALNQSTVNMRYFNLAANGPLNAGNRFLTYLLHDYIYRQVDLEKVRPASLDPRLASRAVKEHQTNDGHLWINYWGHQAEDALELTTV